jgi:hypothetical protein
MSRPLPRIEKVQHAAAPLAEACLGYLVQHPEELLAFMQHAGLDPQALTGAVGSPALEHGLIDYFAANEPILLAFCANAAMTPEQFMRVWYQLNPAG